MLLSYVQKKTVKPAIGLKRAIREQDIACAHAAQHSRRHITTATSHKLLGIGIHYHDYQQELDDAKQITA